MQRITSESYIYSFSASNQPVATAKSGETIEFETLDCFQGQIISEEQTVDKIDFSRINPATGPVLIAGARAGDVLEVAIEEIAVGAQAVTIAVPGLGLLEQAGLATTKVVPLSPEGVASFGSIRLPLQPMIGVIGVAPATGSIPCGTPGRHGGNLDTSCLGAGSRLFLPVQVPGALLALGDVHAAQGDGEVSGTGLECAATVRVTVKLHQDRQLTGPLLQHAGGWSVIGVGEDLRSAARQAMNGMHGLIRENTGLSAEEAYMFCSAYVDLSICQVVNPSMTVRATLRPGLIPFGWPC
jgi:amidase